MGSAGTVDPGAPEAFPPSGSQACRHRAALEGILYAVRTRIGWNRLPIALSGASGTTCWRWLTEWHEARLATTARRTARRRVAGPLRPPWSTPPSPRPQRGDHTGPCPVDRRTPAPRIT
ncbi:transposase [Lentzea sokolovensis]|uniref:transposase n=1 Tax=Lentzea sokolovensis TaxID=3095429 RepID=UPI003872C856